MLSRYLLIAAEPYETISFKIPNLDIDRNPEKLYQRWDPITKHYMLQVGRRRNLVARGNFPAKRCCSVVLQRERGEAVACLGWESGPLRSYRREGLRRSRR